MLAKFGEKTPAYIDFLSNRTARVQINGERIDAALLRQGTILYPPMFVLDTDVLRSVALETVKVTNFADDVSRISSQYTK